MVFGIVWPSCPLFFLFSFICEGGLVRKNEKEEERREKEDKEREEPRV